jgi:hypothetical protein
VNFSLARPRRSPTANFDDAVHVLRIRLTEFYIATCGIY